MPGQNQLRARIQEQHAEQIETVSADRGVGRTEAERVVVREGLESLGFSHKPNSSTEQFLYYSRQVGTVIGVVGLILVGYGVFGAAVFRWGGFGLLLAGFGFHAGATGAEFVADRLTQQSAAVIGGA